MTIGLAISILTGLAGGWIVNYLSDVLPATRRLSQPTCPHCGAETVWKDYFLLRPCRSCGTPRRIRVWIVHLLFIALSIYVWINPPHRLGFLVGYFLLLYFTIVFVIDLEHRLILHPTSIVGALLGLGVGLLRQGLMPTLIGGAVGFAFMYLIYLLGVVFTRMRARRMRSAGLEPDDEDAFGTGDVILSTILGLVLGWPQIWFGILFGVLLGGVISGLLMLGLFLSGQYKNRAWMVFIPFGPFFILSAFLMVFTPQYVTFLLGYVS